MWTRYAATCLFQAFETYMQGGSWIQDQTSQHRKFTAKILKLKSLKDLFIDTKDEPKNIYLSIGDKDFIYAQSLEFDTYLREICQDVSYKIVEGYGHTWDLWNLEIAEFFKLHFTK